MEHYESRLRTIALAIASECRTPDEAAAVLETWREESRFRLDVHAGSYRGDHGKANCMGSIHPSAKVPDWSELGGIDLAATKRCAARTIQFLRSGLWMCAHGRTGKDAWAHAFEYYAVGHCAEPRDESVSRADMQRSIAWRLGLNAAQQEVAERAETE
jgi:hypothetical protein